MNKAQLIDAVAKEVGLSKKQADAAIASVTGTIEKSLKKNDPVALVGFGTFKVSKRKERIGRNPKTGAKIKIKACKVPVFKAGKALKVAVNKAK